MNITLYYTLGIVKAFYEQMGVFLEKIRVVWNS